MGAAPRRPPTSPAPVRWKRIRDWLLTPQEPNARLLALGLAALLIGLGAALVVKWPCFTPWEDGSQYADHCYNDIMPLYGGRHLDQHEVPYLSYEPPPAGGRMEDQPGFSEYPVLTGMAQYAASFLAHDGDSFFVATLPLLALAAAATTTALWRARIAPLGVLGWALLPSFAFYAFNNWDLLAVGLATAGLVAHQRNRPAWSGALLALGASAKFYPAVFLVLVGVDWLRREQGLRRSGWTFGLAAIATLIIVHGPFLLLNPQGWWATYDFHLGRGPTFETPWLVLAHWAEQDGRSGQPYLQALPAFANVLFIASILALAALVGLGRLAWRHACLAAVALFLLLNTVQSAQYALWLLPLVALAPIPWWSLATFVVADAALFWVLWPFFYELDHGGDLWVVFTLVVLARAAAQLLLAGTAVWRGWIRFGPTPKPQAGSA